MGEMEKFRKKIEKITIEKIKKMKVKIRLEKF